MRRARWHRVFAATAVAAAAGCGSESAAVPWQFVFADDELVERAAVVEASIVEGGCNDGELGGAFRYRRLLRPQEPADAPPVLPPGRYCFAGRVFDEGCLAFARGQREVSVPRNGRAPVEVTLAPQPESALCAPAECEGGRCRSLESCGNASVDTGEQCDDGNTDGTDDCRSDCTTGCEPGASARPVAVFDATPSVGILCGMQNALRNDGTTAGLDRPEGLSTSREIDGEVISACLGFDFEQVRHIDQLIVRAALTQDACGVACESDDCSSEYLRLYIGAQRGEYSLVDRHLDLQEALDDHAVPIDAAARYAIVCRGGGGYQRYDVAVESVRAECS